MKSIRISTAILLIFLANQQVSQGYNFETEEANYLLQCVIEPETKKIQELDDKCKILKLYNQTEVDLMDQKTLFNVTTHCACQLYNMNDIWLESFYTDPSTIRVSNMVANVLSKHNQTLGYPDYLWSDIDVSIYQISIFTSTTDFFEQQAHNRSMAIPASLRRQLQKDEIWLSVRRVCYKIAQDKFKLYRYLENLIRANPVVFFKLISLSETIESIYQASKACKLLLMLRLRDYKLRPDVGGFVVVETPSSSSSSLKYQIESENSISNDIDLMLKDASSLLAKCGSWQREKRSLQQLAQDCPMMMSDLVPTNWILNHPSPLDRSKVAIECGCQLLLHNSTWSIMMQDPNIEIMSKSLTNYMNHNRVPDFANSPIWSIYGWFNTIMARFTNSRKTSIKEIVKTTLDDQDPTKVVNRDNNDQAIELLRKGCNYIMFNYNKGKQDNSELKLIKYLGNLQLISQDPMFVFHLTLQNPDLFKLHALSKMCEPIVK